MTVFVILEPKPCNRIDDAALDLVQQKDDLMAEVRAKLVPVPRDLADVLTTMDDDVAKAVGKIQESKAALEKMDMKNLVQQGGSDADRIKRAIVDTSRDAFKEHLPAGQKAITACRQAFKGALKKSRPKGKQPSGQDNEVPALVRKAMEVCTASSEDFVHVKELDMQDPPFSAMRLPSPGPRPSCGEGSRR